MTITINRLPGYGDPIVLDVETLEGANLRRADLSGADLCGAEMRGANLCGANLYRADLRGADLRGADLRGAYLYGATLNRVNLNGANLHGAYLHGAEMRDDIIASLLTRTSRSDGYEFLAFRLADGSVKIMAGCRWMTPEEYRAHVADQYPDTDKAKETLDIIEFIERRTAA